MGWRKIDLVKSPAPGNFVSCGGKAYIRTEGQSEVAFHGMREDQKQKVKEDRAVMYGWIMF